jgi:2-phospho-L-lactate/phosphoenolpyruvate guanylyltransferase
VADPGTGLGTALRAGLDTTAGATALLLGDLPALRADDLGATLAACDRLLSAGAPQVTVPDADGQGTVLLAACSPGLLRPRFGIGSAAAHARVAVVLSDVAPGVRRDVDTDDHLDQAVRLGVGRRTTALLAARAAGCA